MARNTLVINCDLRETRVALIEDGVIAELQIERANQRSTVGYIVLGKVSRVLPGMQAAFIDVGMERAAFLHVEDLIRPDDFEAYLTGDFEEDLGKTATGEGDEEDVLVQEAGPVVGEGVLALLDEVQSSRVQFRLSATAELLGPHRRHRPVGVFLDRHEALAV